MKEKIKLMISHYQLIGSIIEVEQRLKFMKNFSFHLETDNLQGMVTCNKMVKNYLNNQEQLRGNPKIVYLLKK
jgi:hypothetical protein